MAQHDARIIAVVGATGLQGGAVTRRLLTDHWPVRALTRNPDGKKARAIAELGAEVVQADMSDPASLERAFDGVYGVFSVQNHHTPRYGLPPYGVHGADDRANVLPGRLRLAPHAKAHGTGPDRPVGWLTVEDLAVIVATAFSDPDHFIGREVMLASDVRSIEACRAIWREVTGRPPRRFPMPRWLFERFAGTDETTMWRWLGANEVDVDTEPTLAIHPAALTVREWLGWKRLPLALGAGAEQSTRGLTYGRAWSGLPRDSLHAVRPRS